MISRDKILRMARDLFTRQTLTDTRGKSQKEKNPNKQEPLRRDLHHRYLISLEKGRGRKSHHIHGESTQVHDKMI